MKPIRSILTASIALALTTLPALALTLPVSEDTTAGALAKSAASDHSLRVAPGQQALIRFEAGAFAEEMPPTDLGHARLVIYVSKVNAPGGLALHRVTQSWTESGAASPAIEAKAIATIPAASVVAKQFLIIDVTPTVREWLAAPGSDHGFALVSAGGSVLLGAKEGAATGHPAQLQLEAGGDRMDTAAGDDADTAGNGTRSVPNNSVSTKKIKDGAVTTPKLAVAAVTTDRLASGAVTAEKLGTGSVGTGALIDGSVANAKLASASVTADKIASGAITSTAFATGAVNSLAIADGSITNAKLDGGFTFPPANVADGSITTAKLAADAVTTAQIADGTITNADLSNGFTFPPATVADGAITTAKLADGAVTPAKLNLTGANVGIGTAAPAYPLDILHGGSTGLRVKSSASFSVIDIDGFSGDAALRFAANGVNQWNTRNRPSDNAYEIFELGGGGTRFLIQDATGNIGIGTGTPGARLEVSNGTSSLQVRPGELFGVTNTTAVTLEYPGLGTIGIWDNLAVDNNVTVGSFTGGNRFLRLNTGGGNQFTAGIEFRHAVDGNGFSIVSDERGSGPNGLHFIDANLGSPTPGTVMFLQNDSGNVGIGNTAPAARLDVSGNIRCVSLTQTSDARFKTDVRPIGGALATVGALRGVSYAWDRAGNPERNFPDRRALGFLAQEVEKVAPELVSIDAQGYYSVSYSEVVPVLVEATKELRAENTALAAKVAVLEARDRARDARLTKLEAALEDAAPARVVRAALVK